MDLTTGNQGINPAGETVTDSLQAEPEKSPGGQGWRRHPVDLRLTLPWLGGRFYITLIAGREQRAPERLLEERTKYPVMTFGNVFFAFGGLTIVTVFALAALVAQSAIIEY